MAVGSAERKITNRLFKWCQSEDSISSLLAADPNTSPADAWRKLFHHNDKGDYIVGDDHRNDLPETEGLRRRGTGKENGVDVGTATITDEELRRAHMCGRWGSEEPSDLFLKIYHDALCILDDDPKAGMVSPCLMGSSGTMPLTILSVLPDIVRHMSNLIVRAEKEVILVTNFWQNSVASRYITDAIRELSRRAGARREGETRVVVRVLYDRGDMKQLFDPHQMVAESQYAGDNSTVGLPAAAEIPHVDLQVMNYHQPVLGTSHAKYMIVDRRIAVVQSNNIQDNDNLEMMVQVEGPIVDSLYDTALITWNKKLDPPLPCLSSPAGNNSATGESISFDASFANIFSPSGAIRGHSSIVDPDKLPPRELYGTQANAVRNGQPTSGGPTPSPPSSSTTAPPSSDVSETWAEHTTEDPHYDTNLADEVFRMQASVSAKPGGESTMQAVTRHLNHTTNAGFLGDAPECDAADEMTPYIPHPAHGAFPIALVNRAPRGRPSSGPAAGSPQNAAWLSALRNARKSVFIQTPTLNAAPLIPAIAAACERGVDVYCYVCLGYNDAGEMLPMQGGHNEKISHQLHTSLSAQGRQHLHWHWYVGKDQTQPLASTAASGGKRRRSCHVKLMIVDGTIGIVGSGNQDTQSWFHSHEVNLLLDSPLVCRAWAEALRRCQNTGIYGAVDRIDGVWRDEVSGREVLGATGVDAGRFSWLSGVLGAVKRAQGTGGF